MSTQYVTEPPPTATVLLTTSAGPITLSLFTTQTPLTCRNFLQHVLDGTYNDVLFHRVVPGFIVQTGDPSGTGEGGTNVYEDGDKSLERYGEEWGRFLRLPEERFGDRIELTDEFHSRLKFNRRGLVGMARMSDATTGSGQYGSQFFITLGDCRAELDGKCTMFGRIEADGIYNIMRIADGERIEGTDRAVYPEKIVKAEVVHMPDGKIWSDMKPRQRIVDRVVESVEAKLKPKTKRKAAKNLVSFGDDDDADMTILPKAKKAKFNTALISASTANETHLSEVSVGTSISQQKPPSPKHPRKPSFHDSTTQLPLRDTEQPSRSITPPMPSETLQRPKTALELESEIAALKHSMKRADEPAAKSATPTNSVAIPTNALRGRKRPKDGGTTNGSKSMDVLSAFRARLEQAEHTTATQSTSVAVSDDDDLCDLHFIANCLSCSNWTDQQDEADDSGFLGHQLTFEKDRLGKDLKWKKQSEEELVVIDPRERERELGLKKGREKDWDRGKTRDRIKTNM